MDDTAVADNCKFREVHAVKGIKTSGALFAAAGSGNNLAIEDDADIAGKIIGCIQNALEQINFRISIRIGHWLLGAGQNNWLPAILDQIGKRSSCVCHRICSVKDNKSIVIVIVFHNRISDHQPLTGTHICTVDVHELENLQMADFPDTRHTGCQFLTCYSWRQSKIPFFGRNGTTSCYH